MKKYLVTYTCDWCGATAQTDGEPPPNRWKGLTMSNLDDMFGGNVPRFDDICPDCHRMLQELRRNLQDKGRES